MALLKRNQTVAAPPIFADLIMEMPGGPTYRVDVELAGWLKEVQPILECAARVGLAMRNEKRVRVWLSPGNGACPAYMSRVMGVIDGDSHRRTRVSGLQCGDVYAWLHRDGLVEVAEEPEFREV